VEAIRGIRLGGDGKKTANMRQALIIRGTTCIEEEDARGELV